ncbi:MAG: hypothetical protein M3421_02130 [Bacteroidota bacterium]|nr:hypothetical protein [Bacteroidota bacterium]
MYFTRYCPDPLIVTLNPAYNNILPTLKGKDNATVGETNIELVYNGPISEIKSISRSFKNHTIRLSFEPVFPNIAAPIENLIADGEILIQGDSSTGSIRGQYHVNKSGDEIYINMIPTGGWVPNENKLTLQFLYAISKIFKNWPKTYLWNAFIKKDENIQFYFYFILGKN